MSSYVDRREFLQLLTVAGAGLAACCTLRDEEYLQQRVEPSQAPLPGDWVVYATTCRECPAGCGLWARTRQGRAVKLEGNPAHPVNRGALCPRGQAGVQGLYNPDRVVQPLLRKEGKLQPVSWDEALFILRAVAVRAPIAAGRPQGVAWLTGEITDSDADLLEILIEAAGLRPAVNLRLTPEAPLARAAQALFNYAFVPEVHIENATMLVSVGADFLETWGSPVNQALAFTQMHAYREKIGGRAVYVGPRQSITAANCDAWVRILPGRETAALRVLLDGILEGKPDAPDLAAARSLLDAVPLAEAQKALGSVATELRALGAALAAAKAPLVLASGHGADPVPAHAFALLATHLAGGSGRTISWPAPGRPPRGSAMTNVIGLLKEVESGTVEVLLVHEANPVYLVPGALAAIDQAKFVACFTTMLDETASRADLVLPIHHSLETWGDHTASAGVIGILQPTMKALADTRPFTNLVLDLARALGGPAAEKLPWPTDREYFDARLATWHRTLGAPADLPAFAFEAKRRGVLTHDVPRPPVRLQPSAALPPWRPPETGLLAWLFPHPFLYDGRHANKPWLQEVPESTTTFVWDSWAEIHPETARAIEVGPGDAIAVRRGAADLIVRAHVTPQVVRGAIAIPLGQGHVQFGRYADGRGINALRLIDPADIGPTLPLAGLPVTLARAPAVPPPPPLIRVSGGMDQENRELARALPWADVEHTAHAEELPTFYPDHEHPEFDWSMIIDLDACIGCGACVVACYAENNVAVVGPETVAKGREMAWIRVEKYVEGEDGTRFLINLCQHCHHAPCEPVCPVHATYHTADGLNAMVYNRCVGTRYCSNNCTYKVRRFNWFDYVRDKPLPLQYNPDVTVRERGLMEKCSFCVQRIRRAREEARKEKRPVRDGEVIPACAQTCPTRAILFGNLRDPDSRVRARFNDPRAYALLDELGTRPSIRYLKKVLRAK